MLRGIVQKGSRFAMAVTFLVIAPLAAADGLAGTWNFAVEISGMGGGNATVELNPDGEGGLTGTYSGQLGNTDIQGTTDGTQFEFDVAGDMGTVTYSGELKEDGTLEGSLDLMGMGSGEFTATRQ